MTSPVPSAEVQLVSLWTSGLTYMSESEAPLMVLPAVMENDDPATTIEQATGASVGPLTEVPVSAFFEKVLRQQRIVAEEVPAASRLDKWNELVLNLKSHFTAVNVYRSGSVQVGIFIVCRTAKGEQVVIATRAVET